MYTCYICDKTFKSKGNHEMSKSHMENLMIKYDFKPAQDFKSAPREPLVFGRKNPFNISINKIQDSNYSVAPEDIEKLFNTVFNKPDLFLCPVSESSENYDPEAPVIDIMAWNLYKKGYKLKDISVKIKNETNKNVKVPELYNIIKVYKESRKIN
jgi:hypothetical protein